MGLGRSRPSPTRAAVGHQGGGATDVRRERRRSGRVAWRGYGLMMTRVPIGISGYSSSESEISIRMHPCDA